MMNPKKIKSEPAKTTLVITTGFLIVFLITGWQWAIYVSVILGTLGALSTYFAKKIDYLWMKLAWVLSLIIPNIILSVFFYIFLTPIAFLSRTFGKKDPLSLKNSTSTMFKDRNKTFNKKSFENPW